MMALRTVWARFSQDITDFHLMNVDWETASDELVQEAAQRIYNLSAISGEVQKVKTGLGRGLRVMQLPTADDFRKAITSGEEFVGANVERTGNPLPTTREGISDWFDMWGMTGGDPKRQSDFLKGMLTLPGSWKYVRQSAANFFTANILSAPRTIALNVIGPGVISVVKQVERISGAAVQSYLPDALGGSIAARAAGKALRRESAKAYIQTFQHIQDAFRYAKLAAERNHTVIGGSSSSFDALSSYGPITQEVLRATGNNPNLMQNTGYILGNFLNYWPKGFARVNNGLDEFAKRMAYMGEVRTNATVEAAVQGLEGTAAQDFVRQAMLNSTDEVGHATDEKLLREAERVTLTATLGDEGGLLRRSTNLIQAMRGSIPETRYILPVFNVPANGLAETLRRVPGLNVLAGNTAKELSGEMGHVMQADAIGRTMLGGAFMMAGFMMNRAGTLTGAGPQDPQDRKIWLQTHQPYSIKVGGDWVRYDKFDIIGSLLSIPATVSDATVYSDEDKHQDYILSGIGALGQWFKDRSALQNAAQLLAMGSDPTQDASQVLPRIGGNIAGGMVPGSAIVGSVAGLTNPAQNMKRSWEDYVQANLPFNNVETVRNVLGEPIQKPMNSVMEALVPISLVKAIGKDEDPVLTELDRLYQETGYGAGADTTSFSHGFFADKDLKLEDGRSLYTHAMQARQTMQLQGYTLRQALEQLVKSPEYKLAKDADSGRRMTSRGEMSRGWMVSQTFKAYNTAIKSQVAQESPKARAYMTAAAAKQADDAYLRGTSVEELVRNPDLYAASGIDKGAFEDDVMYRGTTADLYRAFGG
jgi:hypothetical protein